MALKGKDCLEEELNVAGDSGTVARGMLLVEELLAPILLEEEPAEGGLAPGPEDAVGKKETVHACRPALPAARRGAAAPRCQRLPPQHRH